MAVINKHLEKAERLLQKGRLEAALEEYLLAWKEEPGNDAIIYTVAELYLRLNKVQECRDCYGYLFDKYVERSDAAKATEILRKIQKLGLAEPKRLLACAQLLETQKPEEAAALYRQALEAVSGGQEPEIALQCAQGLAALQPSSLEPKWRMATLALKLGKTNLASSAYQQIGDLLVTEERYAEAIEALEQSYRLSGNSPAAQLTLAQVCLKAGRYQQARELLEKPDEPPVDSQVMGLLAEAYMGESQLEKAAALYSELLNSSPAALEPLTEIALEYLRQENDSAGLQLLQKLEQHLLAHRQQEGLLAFARKLSRLPNKNISLLEFVSRLFDQLHLDTPLAETLNSLFDLRFAGGEYAKAAESLERMIDVDPYGPECGAKLRRLEGKVSPSVWKDLAALLGQVSTTGEEFPVTAAEPEAVETSQPQEPSRAEEGGNTLHDLMLQADIFLQYRLQDKARERVQRIAKLFPYEEEKNPELRNLFQRVNFTPQYAAPAPLPGPAPSGAEKVRVDLSRVSEISRNLSRQGTVKGVLFAAVNDIGRLWQVSRCLVGLATPNTPPSTALEYIASGVSPSGALQLGKLVMGLQQATVDQTSPLAAESVAQAPELASLRGLLESLQVESLVAIPMRDAEQPTGILVLEQCGNRRVWMTADLAALEALGEQIVLSVANVRLRNLMKTLAVTDERSGLLHRDSYLPCLLSEAERMRAQKSPLTGALLQFSRPKQQTPAPGEPSLSEIVRELSGTIVSRLRQNDIAVKYTSQSLALILPGTTGKDAALVVEKLRKLLSTPSPSGAQPPPQLVAGIAEAIQEDQMDNADVVTELINRLEGALETAVTAGPNSIKVLELPSLRR